MSPKVQQEPAAPKRPQLNLTFKKSCNKDMQLFNWLDNKLNATAYIKEQLYFIMQLEKAGVNVNSLERQEDPPEPETAEQPAAYDLDINEDEMPEF